MATALERIETLEKQLQEQTARLAGAQQFAERALSMAMNTETATGVLGKTLTASILLLKEKGVLSDREILARMQKMDEDEDRRQIADLLSKKILTVKDTVDAGCLVTIKHILIPAQDPKPISIASYRMLELPASDMPPAIRNALIGLKVGETGKVTDQNGDNLFTLIEIYGIAEVSVAGESGTSAESQPETQYGADDSVGAPLDSPSEQSSAGPQTGNQEPA